MRYGMLIDLERCIGCNACTVTCKQKNATPPQTFWSRVTTTEIGEYPDCRRFFLPTLCNHCENAACERVCPTGATYTREDGIVLVDKDKCIGCRMCMAACPYGARTFNFGDNTTYFPEFEEETPYGKSHEGAFVVGTVSKCIFCSDRVDEGNPLSACAQACPAKARVFGDLDDPDSEVSKGIREMAARPLMEEYGTKPCVYYVGYKGGE